MQPSGQLHLGNYFGAARNWAGMIQDYDCFFGIVDQHAITIPYKPEDLRRSVYDTVALYIACGLDPQKCHLFLQSQVTGHTELAWVLACICPLGQLERMTQFKDKSGRQGESVGAGLLYYPVLMAADILLYSADLVPVGEDQKQHVELCRDLAIKFNQTYSPTFPVPEVFIPKTGARIKSLQDPMRKMSKSDPNTGGCLYLLDSPEVIRKKIGSAVTDSGCDVRFDPESKPGISNLLQILSAVTGQSIPELENKFSGINYGLFKQEVSDAVVGLLEPIQSHYKSIREDSTYLEGVLSLGAEVAQKRAYRLLSKVYRKVGFLERAR
jgi:tryptophanyl-tRNA synthetase